jgi:predicted permease
MWLPSNYLIRGLRTELDARAAIFALVTCAITTLVFGLVPILFNRVDLNATLTRTSRGIAGSASQQRARKAFVVAEVVLAFILVFAAGLFFNSFVRLRNAPLGFEPDNRLAMGIVLSGQRYSAPESVVQFADRLIEEVKAVPGVGQVAIGSSLPLGSGPSMNYWRADQPTPPPAEQPTGPGRAVSIDYFRAFDIRIVAGRSFTTADAPGAPHVAVINETLARTLFGTDDAVGRQIVVRPRSSSTWLKEEHHVVVGVAQNSKDVGIHEVDFATVYLPLLQHQPTALQLVAHTLVPPSAALIEQVRRSVLKVDPTLPVLNMNTMADRVGNATRSNRFHLVLLGAFAVIAILLAAIGLYGSIAYATERRIPELALRYALGAQTLGLLLLIVRQAVSLGVAGVAIGVGVAFAIARAIGDALYLVRGQHEGLIYGVTTTDPLTLVIAAAVVTVITIAAGALPARRAVGVDPATVLRAE